MRYRIVETLKKQWERERLLIPLKRHAPWRVALAHPNTYYVGMSNLGLQAAYRVWNEEPDFVCERFFLPTAAQQAAYVQSRTPLRTVESQRPVDEFDVVAFSISFELDYVWLVRMLRMAHLPVYGADREEGHPLVVVGGPCAWMNPLPMAPYVDVFALGDAEILIPVLDEAIRNYRSRADRLAFLAGQPGFYVPAVHGTDPRFLKARILRPRFVSARAAIDPPYSCILTPDTEFGNTFLVEIMRGCVHWCRFCWIGYNHSLRFASLERFLAIVRTHAPADATIGILGGSPTDHPEFRDMLRALVEEGRPVTVSSLRIDTLDEEVLTLLRRAGKRSVTMAPETGSDELRRVVRKPLTNEDLFRAVEAIARLGFQSVKLYYIIGFPTETWDHLRETVEGLRRLSAIAQRYSPSLVIRPSFNCLIPKPGTPFQYAPMEPEDVLNEKIRYLKRELNRLPYVHPTFMSPLYAYYQAILSLGDASVHALIEAIEAQDGAWRDVVRRHLADYADLLFRERRTYEFPHAFITVGFRPGFLEEEYRKALAETPAEAPATM
jgi:radical SAM superfamily enzyme YgiQ (UPF0313 family)